MGVRNNVTVFLNFAKEGFDKAVLVGKLFCCVHVVNTYFCSVVLAYGPSMLPTISTSSSLLLAERVSHRFNKVVPGDIVILRSPEVPRKVLTKCVIGLEGDRVTYVVDPNNSDKSDTVVIQLFYFKIVLLIPFCLSLSKNFYWHFGLVMSFLFLSSFRFQKGIYGLRVITFITHMIQEILVPFLSVFFKAKYFGGYGRLKILVHCDKEQNK